MDFELDSEARFAIELVGDGDYTALLKGSSSKSAAMDPYDKKRGGGNKARMRPVDGYEPFGNCLPLQVCSEGEYVYLSII